MQLDEDIGKGETYIGERVKHCTQKGAVDSSMFIEIFLTLHNHHVMYYYAICETSLYMHTYIHTQGMFTFHISCITSNAQVRGFIQFQRFSSFSSISCPSKHHHQCVSQGAYLGSPLVPSDVLQPFTISGNLAKATARFSVSDQCMKGLPCGLLPLVIWENMILLGIGVGSMNVHKLAAYTNVRLTRTTQRGIIPNISQVVVILIWSVGLMSSMY